jgi:hypothetical protein
MFNELKCHKEEVLIYQVLSYNGELRACVAGCLSAMQRGGGNGAVKTVAMDTIAINYSTPFLSFSRRSQEEETKEGL